MISLTLNEAKSLKFGDKVWLKADRTEGYAKIISKYANGYNFSTHYNSNRWLPFETYGIKWIICKK